MGEQVDWTHSATTSVTVVGRGAKYGDSDVDDYALVIGHDDNLLVVEGDLDELSKFAWEMVDKILTYKMRVVVNEVLRHKGSHGGLQRA